MRTGHLLQIFKIRKYYFTYYLAVITKNFWSLMDIFGSLPDIWLDSTICWTFWNVRHMFIFTATVLILLITHIFIQCHSQVSISKWFFEKMRIPSVYISTLWSQVCIKTTLFSHIKAQFKNEIMQTHNKVASNWLRLMILVSKWIDGWSPYPVMGPNQPRVWVCTHWKTKCTHVFSFGVECT